MRLLGKKCAHCKKKLERGKEFFAEVTLPEFINPKRRAFCSQEHHKDYLETNKGTPSKKPYCLNCDD